MKRLLLVLSLLGTSAGAADPARHDRSYWQAVARAGYAVPAGESPLALVRELSALLGSPDPDLRDRLAYSIIAAWVGGGASFTAEELASLRAEWQKNLASGEVLRRSFSALCLASLVERELEEHFLEPGHYRELLAATLRALGSERDLRGFDEHVGWIHATAHTADLLAALSRHPLLAVEDQARVLAAIAQRLQSAPEVFTQGEQDRLAQAAAALARRVDFDAAGFEDWLKALVAAKRQAARTSPQTLAALAAYQNSTHFLQALYVRLSLAAPQARARADVLDALR